ncbi:MAG: APC family permease [Solitalea-like symbiont of Acarus siro]
MSSNNKSAITVTGLALMTAAAVISLRALPMMAKEELTMFFYIGFATILFLIPASLVSAELGSAFASKGGGVYTWIKEAFGTKLGFTAIWLQWIQNVVWYPTVLGFAAAAISYLIGKTELAGNGYFVGIFSILIYYFATWLTLKGTSFITKVSSFGFILGTIIPGVIIILLAVIYLVQGNPIEFLTLKGADVSIAKEIEGKLHPRYFPHISGMGDIAFLAGILLMFAGVEVHAVHAQNLADPKKEFPKSVLLASIIIFILFTLGSLAIAVVLPYDQIDLQSGLLVTLQILLAKFHLAWLMPILSLLIAFGVLAGVTSWIAGPSSGLLWTAKEGLLPETLAKTNKNGVPKNILLIQAVIVTILSSLYFVIDNVSVAFFLLSALTIGLYLIMYMLMYLAGIKLRYTQPDLPRSYKVPGGKKGMIIIAGIGLVSVIFSFIVSFFPPSQLPIGSVSLYVTLVALGNIIFVALPFIIVKTKQTSKNSN